MKHFTKIFFAVLLTLCFAGTAAFTGTGTASAQESGSEPSDGFIYIPGGSFLMGSPESENWRIDDEVQHEVTVLPFYIDAYETTREEYERLTGEKPGTFSGKTFLSKTFPGSTQSALPMPKASMPGLHRPTR